MIDQNLAHQPRRYSEKVGAVLPSDIALVNQSTIRLVDQRCRLKGLSRSFFAHLPGSEMAKLFVNQGNQLIKRFPFTVSPGEK